MRTHIQKLSVIADKLRERGEVLPEIQLVTKGLASLWVLYLNITTLSLLNMTFFFSLSIHIFRPKDYRIIRSIWAAVPVADRTLNHLLQRLLTEETVVKSYKKNDAAVEAAFASSSGAKGGYTHGTGGYPGTRGRGGRGKPFGIKGGFVDKGSTQHVAQPGSRPFCDHCKRQGHIMEKCYQLHGYPGQSEAAALVSTHTFDPRSIFSFYADSGATKHMCDQRQFFENITAVDVGKWLVSG